MAMVSAGSWSIRTAFGTRRGPYLAQSIGRFQIERSSRRNRTLTDFLYFLNHLIPDQRSFFVRTFVTGLLKVKKERSPAISFERPNLVPEGHLSDGHARLSFLLSQLQVRPDSKSSHSHHNKWIFETRNWKQ